MIVGHPNVRTVEDNNVSVRLIASKYRVAPIKPLTIPRLEFSAAHLLSQLIKKVINASRINFQNIFNFSDSKIVLDWIHGNPNRWKTFVATRVTKITSNTAVSSWHHVPTHLNPADCASRGIFPTELNAHRIWWTGPDFLHEKTITFPQSDGENDNHENSVLNEKKSTVLALNAIIEPSILPSASSYFNLKKVIARCMRFMNNCRIKTRTTGPLIANELQEAELKIIKAVQSTAFGDEIQQLMSNGEIKKTSKIRDLHPFLDEQGILRVGGRLRSASTTM